MIIRKSRIWSHATRLWKGRTGSSQRTRKKLDNDNEEKRAQFAEYQKKMTMDILSYTTSTAALQSKLEDIVKNRQRLEAQAAEAVQEDSEQTLHLGQIIMSVENLYNRATRQRPTIQHYLELDGIHPGSTDQGAEENEDKDSYRYKTKNAINQLRIIAAYIRDFKDIVTELTKKRLKEPRTAPRFEDPEPGDGPAAEIVRVREDDKSKGEPSSGSATPGVSKNISESRAR
mmetsp:Transcript_67957/g.155956  ORF Transcript_67957/g.155956 Transcript_67957/m.155956 type:complete len:230 (-) Transcript_67957:344-1033(-)